MNEKKPKLSLFVPPAAAKDFSEKAVFFWMVEGMDLPIERVNKCDYRWLLRNAGIRNSNHPNFPELMDFLKGKIFPK